MYADTSNTLAIVDHHLHVVASVDDDQIRHAVGWLLANLGVVGGGCHHQSMDIMGDVVWPAGWRLSTEVLASGRGRCRWGSRAVVVDRRLTPAERSATLAHEAVHASRGPCPGWARGREERTVHRLAALALIAPDVLAAELAWSPDPRVIAFDLGVTRDLVDARLDGLDAAEHARLWAVTAHHRDGA
jgi:hypothetical protein